MYLHSDGTISSSLLKAKALFLRYQEKILGLNCFFRNVSRALGRWRRDLEIGSESRTIGWLK